jgi:hypothetical protein
MVIEEQLPPEDEGPLYYHARMPDGAPIYVPHLSGLETGHSVVTYCRAMQPRAGSACARHIMKHLDDHKVEAATLRQLRKLGKY